MIKYYHSLKPIDGSFALQIHRAESPNIWKFAFRESARLMESIEIALVPHHRLLTFSNYWNGKQRVITHGSSIKYPITTRLLSCSLQLGFERQWCGKYHRPLAARQVEKMSKGGSPHILFHMVLYLYGNEKWTIRIKKRLICFLILNRLQLYWHRLDNTSRQLRTDLYIPQLIPNLEDGELNKAAKILFWKFCVFLFCFCFFLFLVLFVNCHVGVNAICRHTYQGAFFWKSGTKKLQRTACQRLIKKSVETFPFWQWFRGGGRPRASHHGKVKAFKGVDLACQLGSRIMLCKSFQLTHKTLAMRRNWITEAKSINYESSWLIMCLIDSVIAKMTCINTVFHVPDVHMNGW